MRRYIVLLPAGRVHVGIREVRGDTVYLSDASTIRRWGTESGLGQLADEGPRPNTVLDPCPRGIEYHYLQELERQPCDPTAWGDA